MVGRRPDAIAASIAAAFAFFILLSYALPWGCACIGPFTRDAEPSQGLGL